MTARLTPTEALLSCAAAETLEEMFAARLALIETGSGAITQLDTTGLARDFTDPETGGLAGQYILGGSGLGPADTCARRSRRLLLRLRADLATPREVFDA